MIDKRLVPYSGLKKEPFSGSHNGMRYMMRLILQINRINCEAVNRCRAA